jgi:RHS repeat-associated protein
VPRDPTNWSGTQSTVDQAIIAGITRHGYTGHTMLGNSGLIHMNGRVMDASIGRFISADPYISAPGNTQGFNRYAYVGNNPLSYTDPTGFKWVWNPDTQKWEWELDEVKVPGSRPGSDPPPNVDLALSGGTIGHISSPTIDPIDTLDEVVVLARIQQCYDQAASTASGLATIAAFTAVGAQGGLPGALAGLGVGVVAASVSHSFEGDSNAATSAEGLVSVMAHRGNPSEFFGLHIDSITRQMFGDPPGFGIVAGGIAGNLATNLLTSGGVATFSAAKYGALGGLAYLATYNLAFGMVFNNCMAQK